MRAEERIKAQEGKKGIRKVLIQPNFDNYS